MSEKKLIATFVVAILVVGVVWYFADQKFKNVKLASAATLDLEFNDGPALPSDDDAGTLKLGDSIPLLTGDWIAPDGAPMSAPLYAGKVVLVDVWSTFCPPCVASIPNNNEFVKKYEPKGLFFVGAAPQLKGLLTDFKTKVSIQYPLLATSEALMKEFKIEYFPSMFLFGKDGKLIWQGSHIVNKQNRLMSSFSKALKSALGPIETVPEKKAAAAAGATSTLSVQAINDIAQFVNIPKAPKKVELKIAEELGLEIGAGLPPLVGDWISPSGAPPEIKGKVLLLDFFNTECGTCIESLPFNNKIFEKFAPQGLMFVNATPEEKMLVKEFKRTTPINYPVLANCEDLFRFCFVMGTPTTMLFDRSGKLIWKGERVESNGKLQPDFEKALTSALASK